MPSGPGPRASGWRGPGSSGAPGEPFTRVHLCYWLRPAGRPAEPSCGIDYLVSADPPHVEVAEAFGGLGRELEAGRERFVRGLDRELDLRRDPAAKALERRALAVRPLRSPVEAERSDRLAFPPPQSAERRGVTPRGVRPRCRRMPPPYVREGCQEEVPCPTRR